jgi:hypothetical protein
LLCSCFFLHHFVFLCFDMFLKSMLVVSLTLLVHLCKFLYSFILVLHVSNFLGFFCLMCCVGAICLDFTLHSLSQWVFSFPSWENLMGWANQFGIMFKGKTTTIVIYWFLRRNHCTNWSLNDALPSHGVRPSWRSHKVKLRNQDLVARSRLPTLEKGRGSSWEPRD